jgi:hypothetical protein
MPQADAPERNRREDAIALAGLLALHLVLFGRVLTGTLSFYVDDFQHYQFPLATLVGDALRHGRLPLWNPYLWLGTPLAANPAAGVFYPTSWLAAINPLWGLNASIVFHLLLGGGLTYYLARERVGSGICAFAAAVAFSMGGIALSYTGNPFYLFSLAWLPAVLWAFVRNAPVRGAFATCLMILAGDVQVLFGALVVLGALGAARIADAPRGERRSTAIGAATEAAIIVVGGILLASIALLPALEATRSTERAFPMLPAVRDRWSTHPARLVTFVLPYFFGSPLPEYTFWGNWIDGEGRFWFHSIYSGALIFIGALVAVRRKSTFTVALGVAGLVLLLLAMGTFTPLYPLTARVVPMFDRFRYPEKLLAPLAVLLPLLGAEGLAKAGSRRLGAALAALVLVGAAAWMVAGSTQSVAARFVPVAPVADVVGTQMRHDARHLLILALLASAAWWAAHRSRISVRTGRQVLAAFASADVVLAATALVWLAPSSVVRKPGAAAALLAHDGPVPPRVLLDGRAETVPLHRDLAGHIKVQAYRRDILQPAINVCARVGQFIGYGSVHPAEDDWVVFRMSWQQVSTLAARLGTSYVIAPEGVGRIPTALPPARLAGADVESGTLVRARDLIFKQPPDRVVIDTDDALLEGDPLPAADARALTSRLPAQASGSARITSYAPEEITVATDAPGAAMLVLTDAWFPGWHASVDGHEAPIFRADALARAIPVPAGRHQVRFWFDVPTVWLGARLSLSGLLLLVLVHYVRVRAQRAAV